jgi:thymidylate synthase ThyX
MLFEDYEEFSESQLKILEHYVTNSRSHIFALRNLPEVIKGALFSRYSRSSLGLRTLLLKEFVANTDESAFSDIVVGGASTNPDAQMAAIKKAQNFYDRILDGYGDDSIGELGGAHLALEHISILAAKAVEDSRIGGSPLEKSTRYIYFDQKVQGEYLFYREPVLMTSAFRDLYIDTCNMLFDTYSRLVHPMAAMIEEKTPRDPNISNVAYAAALRARVLDCLRGLLPAATLTNMGIYGNGRFFDQLINKLQCHNLVEMQDIGKRTYEELAKIIPSFIRRAHNSHRTHRGYAAFNEAMQAELKNIAEQHTGNVKRNTDPGVRLVAFDPDAVYKVAASLLYPYCNKDMHNLIEYCKQLSEEELAQILDTAANARENRRHKSPRALECTGGFTFEIVADFGIYRDLHRHRMLTQERQLLTCDYGFYIPQEIVGTAFEADYVEALERAKEAFDAMVSAFPEEAQYVVPMAFNVRWYFNVNLRALQWLCELRSAAAGHPAYRYVAQTMAKQVIEAFPAFERYFKFVDYEGYEMGRLGQEQYRVEKSVER